MENRNRPTRPSSSRPQRTRVSAHGSSSSKRPVRGQSSTSSSRRASQGRHASAQGGSSRTPMNASGLDLSSSRRKKKADRGFVSQITPTTSSGESDAQFSRRSSRGGFAKDVQRKSRVKSIVMMLAFVLLIAGVGIGVGVAVYFGSSDSKLALSESNAGDALVAPVEGEAYYALLAAELGSAVAEGGDNTDAYLLVRIDEANTALTFISIPSNLSVGLSDGSKGPLYSTRAIGGDAELIGAVAEFAGVDISHYARTNADGIKRMVELAGGVPMTLTEEVDDPRASTRYLMAGEQTLDGEAALAVLRASNFTDGLALQATHRIDFTLALAYQALSKEGLSFASELSSMADSVQTSWSASELMSLGEVMRPLDSVTLYKASVPGYEASGTSGTVFVDSTEKWKGMMASVDAGLDPNEASAAPVSVDRAAVTVEVRNGGGVTGAGAKMGEGLTAFGYVVEKVGNTDDGTTYPETLVVYKDGAYEAAAQAIVSDMSAGRVVNGGDFYTFETNILVVVGKDWVPVS